MKQYIPTLGVNVHHIQYGKHTLNILDTSGQEKYGNIIETCYSNTYLFLSFFFFLMYQQDIFPNIKFWIKYILKVILNPNIMIIASKIDSQYRLISDEDIIKHFLIQYHDISTLRNIDCYSPLLIYKSVQLLKMILLL